MNAQARAAMLQPIPIPGLFITGTDTDVGKTVIAGAIANYFLREQKSGQESFPT